MLLGVQNVLDKGADFSLQRKAMRTEYKRQCKLACMAGEEELVVLQAKLGERDATLKAYKSENSRFADMKEKFKADIVSLQQQVSTC